MDDEGGIEPEITRVRDDCTTLYSRGHSQRPTQEHRHQVGARCDKGCGEPYTIIRAKRLSYFGHVARMQSSRIPNIMMYGRVQGKRPVGRPKKRWLDNVREDCHLLDMNMEDADRLARRYFLVKSWRKSFFGQIKEKLGDLRTKSNLLFHNFRFNSDYSKFFMLINRNCFSVFSE